MLDPLARATLVAVDRLTRETYGHTDGGAVADELKSMGYEPDDAPLLNLLDRLKKDGYLDAQAVLGTSPRAFIFMTLTTLGRQEAFVPDPFERVLGESRHILSSTAFSEEFPGAFQSWAAAERLLWEDDSPSNLTTIGHNVREAMQAFATAMVEAHQPPGVDASPANVEKRLGAVIALYRLQLGDARREALEALGTLWTKTNRLVQRQEHGAQKEGEPITWSDARRVVYLTMFCMVEFADTLEDITSDPPAQLEGGQR